MKILVTGGSGFVGSHLVDRLIALGHSVAIVDHMRSSRERFIHEQARVYRLAIGDPGLDKVFEKEQPDAVFHLAAQISVTDSIANPIADAQTNIVDALNVLMTAQRHGVQRFLFASSGGAIYGDHPLRPTPEVMDAFPLSPYGVAKQTFEHYLHYAQVHHGLSALSFRFSNIYGPRQPKSSGYAGVMPIFISSLLEDKPVKIFGDGTSTRDYLFVDDAVDAFVSGLESVESGVMNISTGIETNVQELWDMLVDIHGKEHPVTHEPKRAGEVERSHLSAETAQTRLGWQPKTAIKDGLKKTYDWFRSRFSNGT